MVTIGYHSKPFSIAHVLWWNGPQEFIFKKSPPYSVYVFLCVLGCSLPLVFLKLNSKKKTMLGDAWKASWVNTNKDENKWVKESSWNSLLLI